MNRTHFTRGAGVLCGQKFPKPKRTAFPDEVTCCACANAAKVVLRTEHKDQMFWRGALSRRNALNWLLRAESGEIEVDRAAPQEHP